MEKPVTEVCLHRLVALRAGAVARQLEDRAIVEIAAICAIGGALNNLEAIRRFMIALGTYSRREVLSKLCRSGCSEVG